MKHDGCGFQYLKVKFYAEKSDAKLIAGIFIGPKIRELMSDSKFRGKLNPFELAAWDSFVLVVQNHLGNRRAENYVDLINNMLTAYGMPDVP